MQRAVRWLVTAVTLGVVVALAEIHAHLIGHYHLLSGTHAPWDAAYIAVLTVAAYSVGIPDVPRTVLGSWVSSFVAVAVAAVFVSLAQLAIGTGVLPRFVIFGALVFLVPSYALLSTASYHIRSHGEVSDRVIVVARGDQGEMLRADLARAPERPAVVVGSADPRELEADQPTPRSLREVVRESKATLIVLDREAQSSEAVVAQAAELHAQGTRVRMLSSFYEEWLGKMPLPELERVSLMFDIQEIHAAQYARVKRLCDIVLALLGSVALIVSVPLVLVLDLAGNRGPLFYRQRRVGIDGTEFTILKFRTMRQSSTSRWTERGDQRVGRVGRWLRRTHIDELPQVINILRGDLSLVGPRPEQPTYVEELRQKIPFYDVRHLVHPGLTGWAQVKFDYGASVEDALEKLQYEFFYLRHQSLSLDARIVARTLRSLIWHPGR